MRRLFVVLVLILAGCGGGGDKGSAPSTTAAAVTTAPAPSTTTLSVQRVASVVAGHGTSMQHDWAAVGECTTAGGIVNCSPREVITLYDVATDGREMRTELQALTQYPAEVADLVRDTIDAVDGFNDAILDAHECSNLGDTSQCGAARALHAAGEDLDHILGQWSPYL